MSKYSGENKMRKIIIISFIVSFLITSIYTISVNKDGVEFVYKGRQCIWFPKTNDNKAMCERKDHWLWKTETITDPEALEIAHWTWNNQE